jgi:putative hydrolase of the HAD superfamily
MAGPVFDLIAFDGDDTLWHNERSYREARDRFWELLTAAGVEQPREEVDACLDRVELGNLRYFGYGVSSFTMSLMETAITVTNGRIASGHLHAIIDLAKAMMSETIDVFPGAGDTLAALSATHPLMLITKGDLLHQTSKLDRSGLQEYFAHVEVVSHKTPAVYRRILDRHRVEPARFVMIGNSLRSDVLPVVDAGGWAVHVPAALGWSHEHADPTPFQRQRFVEAAGIDEVRALIGSFDTRNASAR